MIDEAIIDNNVEVAQETIRRGERSRVLFELLLAEIGGTYENTRSEIWDKLKETQDAYNEAVTTLTAVIKEAKRH